MNHKGEYQFKGTKGDWKMMIRGFTRKGNIPNLIQIYATNNDLEMVCKVCKDGLLHNREQYFEENAKLIVIAGNLAQKFDPETWETRLTQFEEMKTALDKIANTEYPEDIVESYRSYVNSKEIASSALASLTEKNEKR